MDRTAQHMEQILVEKNDFSRQQQGGGSVMIWACFSYYLNSWLMFLDKYVDVKKYVLALE